jgi:hypothetical protein
VAGDDRRVAGQPEPECGLAHVVRPADQDQVQAVIEGRVVATRVQDVLVEHVEAGCRRGGDEARLTQREQAGVLGMDRFDVLRRIQRTKDAGLRHLTRERPQDEDAGDAGVGVELADRGHHVGFLSVVAERLQRVAAPQLVGQSVQPPLVPVGAVVVSDQHDPEADGDPAPVEVVERGGEPRLQLLRHPRSVDDVTPRGR